MLWYLLLKNMNYYMLHFYMLAEALGANSIAYDEIPGLTEQSLSLDLQIELSVDDDEHARLIAQAGPATPR